MKQQLSSKKGIIFTRQNKSGEKKLFQNQDTNEKQFQKEGTAENINTSSFFGPERY